MKTLIIAEKPKVAEKIAHFLNDKPKYRKIGKVGYFEFEKDGNIVFVASAVGHIYSLKGKNAREIPVFDVEWVPSYEINKNAGYVKEYIKLIERLAKDTDVFVSACDYDIEGSLIGFNAIRFAAHSTKGKRMKFSALTKEDILNAYENMEELDYYNAYAGETRHILDWYWGINLSRALMSAIRMAGVHKVLSIGRVQGPALDILAKREKEIIEFKPTPYWQVFVEKNGIRYIHENEKFWKEEDANKVYSNTDKRGIVSNVLVKKIQVPPPPPFDLTSLQIEAYRVYKMSPKEVLSIAQNLYENSYISYPRTSSQKLPEKLGLKRIIEKIGSIDKYKEECNYLLSNKLLRPHEGSKTDPAHPAIHPTGIYGNMGGQEEKLYDLIVKRFLACFGESAVKEKTKVVLKMGSENYVGEGTIIDKKGWIELYGRYYSEEEVQIPRLNKGEVFIADSIVNEKKMTQPPKRYTPTSLVKTLENKNLGTKTTRALIIDTLFQREYVKERSIEVTELGMKVHDVLEKYCPKILDEKLTEEFENKINLIQEGKANKDEVLSEARDVLRKIISDFLKNEEKIGIELLDALKASERKERFIMKCEKCGGDLIVKNTRDSRIFIGCTNYPRCNNAYPIPSGVKKVKFVEKCERCGAPVIKYYIKKKMVKRCLNTKCNSTS
ncbi:MAG: DNA topoisomerase I [Candidatus Micrarchaeia archaeon]